MEAVMRNAPGPQTWAPKARPEASYRATERLPFTPENWAWCVAEAARIHGQPARVCWRDGRRVEIPERVAEARHTAGFCAVFVNQVVPSYLEVIEDGE